MGMEKGSDSDSDSYSLFGEVELLDLGNATTARLKGLVETGRRKGRMDAKKGAMVTYQ